MTTLPLKKRGLAYVIALIVLTAFLVQCTLVAAAATEEAESDVGKRAPDGRDKRIVAVLFSVGQNKDILKRFDGVSNLDLLRVNGEPLIKHVYDVLCQSRYIQKIVVVASPEVEKELRLDGKPKTSFVIDRRDAAKNVRFGIDEICKGDLIMFIPSDLPLVTPEGLDSLIERVLQDKEVDAVFPLIGRDVLERKYPSKEPTYAHFKEGQYTAAHVEFLRPDIFLEHSDQVVQNKDNLYNVYDMRKSALGMARFLGIGLTLKYIFGILSPHDIEQLIYRKYKFRAEAIFWNDADLAADLSEPADIQMINSALQQRALAHSQIPPATPSFLAGVGTESGV